MTCGCGRARRGKPLPARGDIDILDFGSALGHLLLLEVIDGGRDFRYVVFASEIMRVWGRDMHQRRVSDFPDDISGVFLEMYRRVMRERVPYFTRIEGAHGDSAGSYDRLVLPLGDDGESVDRLMTAIYPRTFRRPVLERL